VNEEGNMGNQIKRKGYGNAIETNEKVARKVGIFYSGKGAIFLTRNECKTTKGGDSRGKRGSQKQLNAFSRCSEGTKTQGKGKGEIQTKKAASGKTFVFFTLGQSGKAGPARWGVKRVTIRGTQEKRGPGMRRDPQKVIQVKLKMQKINGKQLSGNVVSGRGGRKT